MHYLNYPTLLGKIQELSMNTAVLLLLLKTIENFHSWNCLWWQDRNKNKTTSNKTLNIKKH